MEGLAGGIDGSVRIIGGGINQAFRGQGRRDE